MRSPLARYYDATKSWPAAILLYQIAYWMPKAKIRRDGHTWIAKPATDWCTETALTPQQYKDAVRILRHARLILTERHQFNGKLMTFLRLTTRGADLMASKSLETPSGWSPQAPNGQGLATPNKDPGHTGNTDEQEEDGVLAHAGLLSQGSCNQDSGEETGMKAHQVLEKIHKPAHEMTLVTLWCAVLAELKGAYVAPFTNKQKGQLKQFAKKCPPGKVELVLEHVLRHWLIFIESAEANAGVYKTPASPDVGFLLKHAGIAINLWQKHVAEPKLAPTTQLIAEPKKVPEPAEPKPTYAEAMDYFFPQQGS